jgi:hypothetical protein
MKRNFGTAVALIFLIICIGGCLEPQELFDTDSRNEDAVNVRPSGTITSEILTPNENASGIVSEYKIFSNEGITLNYPESYSLVEPGEYADEALELQSSFLHPQKVLGLLKSSDNRSLIGIYRYSVGGNYEARTAEGIYNYVKNEMAMAKNNEQLPGKYNSNYRGVERILVSSIPAYIIEVQLENQSIKYEFIGQGEWISAGSEFSYYLPLGRCPEFRGIGYHECPAGYIITFSYPKTIYANADRDNRMNILQSITVMDD